MSDITFHFIGWCHEDNHDKVWVSFSVNNRHYAGWGRRDAKIQFKEHSNIHSLDKIERKKRQKYDEVDRFQLFAIFPDLEENIEKDLVMAVLSDKIK